VDSALLSTLIFSILGAIVTVFTRRQGSASAFESRLNGNGKQRSTGEVEILRVHTEITQDERLAGIERWRNAMDERYFELLTQFSAHQRATEESIRHFEELTGRMVRQMERLEDCCKEEKTQATDIRAAESEAAA